MLCEKEYSYSLNLIFFVTNPRYSACDSLLKSNLMLVINFQPMSI